MNSVNAAGRAPHVRPTEVLGSTTPRIWTPPLRDLTPDTSMGFDQIDFARDVLNRPPDPWQEWLWIHAGELLPDGRPRFRIVLVLVARQNGKTESPAILAPYWLFVDEPGMILGTSTKLEYATETWDKSRKLIQGATALEDEHDPKRWFLRGAGNIEMWTKGDARYKVAAANEEGGRSLTVRRLICDELRQHHDYSAWNAAEPATSAVRDAQIWALSNAGDERSVVLNDLRESALEFLETGRGDYRLGIFEWSAPEDADPEDIHALAMANPNLNRRLDGEALLLSAARAKKLGGKALTGFKTESMCIRVKVLNPAIDPGAWSRCKDPDDMTAVRGRVALAVDMSPDGRHVSAVAAAVLPDGRVRVEVVGTWPSALAARAALPALVTRVRPQTFGWFPSGPAAALAADLAVQKGPRRAWPPPGVTVTEIRGELAAACMGLEEQVSAGMLAHSDDPLLNLQVSSAERMKRGDTWVFVRPGDGHVDAVYATAGAVHLARTMPPPVGPQRLILAEDVE